MASNIVLILFVAFEVQLSLKGTFAQINISATSTPMWGNRTAYSSTEETSDDDCYDTKHYLFCNCSVQVVLYPQDYKNESGVLHVKAFNISYNISFYDFYNLDEGHVIVCQPDSVSDHGVEIYEREDVRQHLETLYHITLSGLGVSLLGTFMHLIFFLVHRELRNMPGYNLASLCVSMFCGHASFMVGAVKKIYDTKVACLATAATTLFFLLSSFFWMNVISFDIFRTMWNSASKLRIISAEFKCRKFTLRWIFCGVTSLAIVILAMIVDHTDRVPVKYRPLFGRSSCWFHQLTSIWIFFVGPAFVSIGFNVIFFGLSAYVIICNRAKTDDPRKRGQAKKNLILYSKLALITGMLWLSGVLARITNRMAIWYVFAVLNILQGFFIFLAFTPALSMITQLFNSALVNFRKLSSATTSSAGKAPNRTGPSSESPV